MSQSTLCPAVTKSRPAFSVGETITGLTTEGTKVTGSVSMISEHTYRLTVRSGRYYAILRKSAKLPAEFADRHIAARVLAGEA